MKKIEKDNIKKANDYILEHVKNGSTPYRASPNMSGFVLKPLIKKDKKEIKKLYEVTEEII